MWALVVGGALAVVAVVVVLLPFFRQRREAEPDEPFDPSTGSGRAEGVRVQREGIYQALETLRLERELGQVDDAEYERQAGEYRRMAALLVREQERLLAEGASEEDGGPNDQLEREVAEARERLRRMEDEAP
ncbi:MAG: hypothetical protein OXN15_01680 [Chloroflexota bacterium]|nr:hypothetical protein [Chloroflexota bacterium]MDE2968956.1 hypothetical protein [Chloroflexota bacterium]